MLEEIEVVINTTDENCILNGEKTVTLNKAQLSDILSAAAQIVKAYDNEFDQEDIDTMVYELKDSLAVYNIYNEDDGD